MQITIIASSTVFDQSVRAAREVGKGGGADGLAAPLGGVLLGALQEAWDVVESALKAGFRQGKANAHALLESAKEKVDALIDQAGVHGREVEEMLIQRMQTFAVNFVHGSLAGVPAELKVGGGTLALANVSFTQKLVVSGSFKAALTELFAMTSQGEVQIEVMYGAPHP